MQKEKSIFHLLVTALFIGILLSFALFYLICTVYEHDYDIAPSCLDGSVIEGEDFTARFERAVYQNKRSLSRIREYNYLFFRTVNDPGVIAGLDSFLFEIQNPENEYHYFDDYLGECAFDEKELSAILSSVGFTREEYEEEYSEEKRKDALFYAKDLKDRYTVLWLYDRLFRRYETEVQA
jgi:hypothetical protein